LLVHIAKKWRSGVSRIARLLSWRDYRWMTPHPANQEPCHRTALFLVSPMRNPNMRILGFAQHVAVRKPTPSRVVETICHGGTCNPDGFEISSIPDDKTAVVTVVLADSFPSSLTSA
jgi:hypothetical protein